MSGDRNTWKAFEGAVTVAETLSAFETLKHELNIHPECEHLEVFDQLSAHCSSFNSSFWSAINHYAEEKKTTSLKGRSVLIVGSGPAGLITAIETTLAGGRPILIDKREEFSRRNVLLLWDYTVEYLKKSGFKALYPRFCFGDLNHISINKLQLNLLKMVLIYGVPVKFGYDWKEAKYEKDQWVAMVTQVSNQEVERQETANFLNRSACEKINYRLSECHPFTIRGVERGFDMLVGADGLNSVVGEFAQFEYTTIQAQRAIGVTFNFVNSKTPEENHLDEFGIVSYMRQEWFKELKDKYNITLENCAYYRDETHYFVCTVIKDCLLELNIVKQDHENLESLLARENINHKNLEDFGRKIASHCKVPEDTQFERDSHGDVDIQLFDFTKKRSATAPVKIIQPQQSLQLSRSMNVIQRHKPDHVIEVPQAAPHAGPVGNLCPSGPRPSGQGVESHSRTPHVQPTHSQQEHPPLLRDNHFERLPKPDEELNSSVVQNLIHHYQEPAQHPPLKREDHLEQIPRPDEAQHVSQPHHVPLVRNHHLPVPDGQPTHRRAPSRDGPRPPMVQIPGYVGFNAGESHTPSDTPHSNPPHHHDNASHHSDEHSHDHSHTDSNTLSVPSGSSGSGSDSEDKSHRHRIIDHVKRKSKDLLGHHHDNNDHDHSHQEAENHSHTHESHSVPHHEHAHEHHRPDSVQNIKKAATLPAGHVIPKGHSGPLYVTLVGDALVEPFWPQGTGANRALLSAQDVTYFFGEYISSSNTDEVLEKAERIYKKLFSITPDGIKKDNPRQNGGEYQNATNDPATRYVVFV